MSSLRYQAITEVEGRLKTAARNLETREQSSTNYDAIRADVAEALRWISAMRDDMTTELGG